MIMTVKRLELLEYLTNLRRVQNIVKINSNAQNFQTKHKKLAIKNSRK